MVRAGSDATIGGMLGISRRVHQRVLLTDGGGGQVLLTFAGVRPAGLCDRSRYAVFAVEYAGLAPVRPRDRRIVLKRQESATFATPDGTKVHLRFADWEADARIALSLSAPRQVQILRSELCPDQLAVFETDRADSA